MGRITILNSISALFVGGIGAAIGAVFGREAMRWGILIGVVSGFVFPFYPLFLGQWLFERVTGREKRHIARRDSEDHHPKA